MELKYKADKDHMMAHFKAWWEHEYFGRCALSVKAPRRDRNAELPPAPPEQVEDRWLDFEYLSAYNDYRMRNTYYGGEAFPIWNPGYPGVDTHAAYLGAPVVLSEDTGWLDPVIDQGNLTDYDFHDFRFDKNGKWYQFGMEIRRLAVRESLGKSFPGNMAFGACGDTLAALRSSNKLLFDVMDCPDYIREFELYLMGQWIEIYKESYKITHATAEGSTCWFELWSPGKFYAVQCDYAYMISPRTFVDIFLPSIEMQLNYLDHTVYHVDGTGNFVHIDTLLELPRLQALQILPGTGKPSPLFYMDMLKKVQAAGKNLVINIAPEDVESALGELSARGLFIDTVCRTQDDAEDLLKLVERWSVDRG